MQWQQRLTCGAYWVDKHRNHQRDEAATDDAADARDHDLQVACQRHELLRQELQAP